MKQFLVFITRTPDFTGESIPAHRQYPQELRDSQLLTLAGGFPDQTGGAYILQCQSAEEAQSLIAKDPMNQPKEAIYQLKEWNAN